MREIRVADTSGKGALHLLEYREVIDDLRSGFLSAPADEVVDRHLADMLVVFEATRHLSRDARRRRRSLLFGSTLGVGAMLAAGGAAASAGGLPPAAQAVVSDLVAPFGFDLPSGRSDEAPGRGGLNPGRSESAPGQQDASGNSENAPGHGGENPGRSDTAPGHSDSTNNAPTSPPGSSGEVGRAPAVPPGLEDGTGRPADPGAQGKGKGKETADGVAPSTNQGDNGTRRGNAETSGEPD